MIMARRDRLLVSDYVDAMQLLMHSPLGDDPIDPTTPVSYTHLTLPTKA